MRFKGRSIFDWEVPRSGVTYKNPRLDEIFACRWAGYQFFHDWLDLENEQKEELIAAYRIESQINAVVARYRKPRRKRK